MRRPGVGRNPTPGHSILLSSLTASSLMPKSLKVKAKPLADPDALVPGVPEHVEHPDLYPPKPLSGSTAQTASIKRRIKAIERRLRSR